MLKSSLSTARQGLHKALWTPLSMHQEYNYIKPTTSWMSRPILDLTKRQEHDIPKYNYARDNKKFRKQLLRSNKIPKTKLPSGETQFKQIRYKWANPKVILRFGSIVKGWTNKVSFEIPLNMAKPELKSYLYHLYGQRVKKVHTHIKHGETRKSARRKHKIYTPHRKIAYVWLHDPVRVSHFSDKEIRRGLDMGRQVISEDLRSKLLEQDRSIYERSVPLTWDNRKWIKKFIDGGPHEMPRARLTATQETIHKRRERHYMRLKKNVGKKRSIHRETPVEGQQDDDILAQADDLLDALPNNKTKK